MHIFHTKKWILKTISYISNQNSVKNQDSEPFNNDNKMCGIKTITDYRKDFQSYLLDIII